MTTGERSAWKPARCVRREGIALLHVGRGPRPYSLGPWFESRWAHQFSTAMPAFERALLFLAATKRLAVTIWYYSSRSSRSLLYEHFERARLAQPGNHHNPQSTGGH